MNENVNKKETKNAENERRNNKGNSLSIRELKALIHIKRN